MSNAGGFRSDPVAVPCLRIGPVAVSPPIVQAPMAGFTNSAFRQIVRGYGGVGLMFTEMVSAKGFEWLDDHRSQLPDRLAGIVDEPRPLGVQIWDNDAAVLARVGQCLAHEYGVSVVDINFGCPVSRVAQKAQSGSYLLRDPHRVGMIVQQVVRACAPVPVTAKIRLGRNRREITAGDVAQAVEDAGAAALTLHGRTAADFFGGQADWQQIAAVRSRLHHIPLIGNGDIRTVDAAVDAFAKYGVDGIMLGRALLRRPWLAYQIQCRLEGRPVPANPTSSQERACVLTHYQLLVQRFGIEKGTMLMRKYACCYAQSRPGARRFRTHVAQVRTPSEFQTVLEQYFPRDSTTAELP